MRILILLASIFLIGSLRAQIAKTFYFDGINNSKSGAYVAAHPTQNLYYTAIEKAIGGHTVTTLVCLDAVGKTLWYCSTPHFGSMSSFNGIGGILVTATNIFVSSYIYPTLTTATLNIYKYDHAGQILDSLIISSIGGLSVCKGDMAFSGDGNIFTVFKGSNNVYQYCKINPNTMDLITMVPIGYSNYTNTNIERSMFTTVSGFNTVITLALNDTIKFVTLDLAANILSTNFIHSPDGQLTDIYFNGLDYSLLINKMFSGPFAASVNPLRIIKADGNFSIQSNSVFPVSKAVVFTSIISDLSGGIFVATKNSNFGGGSVIKISGTSISYEHPSFNSNFTDIGIAGNRIVLAGHQTDVTQDCTGENRGNVFVNYNKLTVPNFEVVSAHMPLHLNNITTTISYNSSNFEAPFGLTSNYNVSNSGSTIYTSSLLISAIDINSNLKVSSSNYNNIYAAGPITNPNGYSQLERDRWERVWKINRTQIDEHIQAHLMGDVNYSTPEVILNWPGNGNTAIGQLAQLTRYKDLNNNMIYEPLLGEYPLILGDFCVLSIYNDMNADTSESCSALAGRAGVEVYEYIYGFDCAQDSSLQNSLFVHYEIINKSGTTLYDTHIGNFIDYDINLAIDDYASSDVERGMFYGRDGFGSGPQQGYIILGAGADADGLDNAIGIGAQQSINGYGYGDGIIDNERLGMTNFVYFNLSGASNGDPNSPLEFYNMMRSMWHDGSPVYYGGDGCTMGTTSLTSKFTFQGDSDPMWYSTGGIDPGFAWTEEMAGNPPGDRRGMASSGPFTLQNNDTVLFDIAYVTGIESISGGYTSNEALLNCADSVRQFFKVNETPCSQDFDFYEPFDGIYPFLAMQEKIEKVEPILFPNPTTGMFTIQGLSDQAKVSINDLAGQLLEYCITNQSSISFDYCDFPAGVYFVKIQSDNYIGTIKFIKQ